MRGGFGRQRRRLVGALRERGRRRQRQGGRRHRGSGRNGVRTTENGRNNHDFSRKIGRGGLDSLAQRGLRQGALDERAADRRRPARRCAAPKPRGGRPEQPGQAVRHRLHGQHRLDPPAGKAFEQERRRPGRPPGPRSAITCASACASPKPRLTPWPASGWTPCAASPTSASRCATSSAAAATTAESRPTADDRDQFAQRLAARGGHPRRPAPRGQARAAPRASASGADHTIEIRRPGSGSHARTLPSARNHWRATPVMRALAGEIGHDGGLAVGLRLGRRCPRPARTHERSAVGADHQPRRQRSRRLAGRAERQRASSADHAKPTNGVPPMHVDPGIEDAAAAAPRAARAPRRSTPARARPGRRRKSRASRRRRRRSASPRSASRASEGSRCHAPSARRKRALPGLIA